MSRDHEDAFRYDKMVEKALRSVVKQALNEVVEQGIVDDHHFYITFLTDHPGVKIPDYLRERYPGEMTIVLQHQFWDLKVDRNARLFSVGLSFGQVPSTLVVPFAAVTAFWDPHVRIGLRFGHAAAAAAAAAAEMEPEAEPEAPLAEAAAATTGPQVVQLDAFRRGPARD